jgi:hypothetical protein
MLVSVCVCHLELPPVGDAEPSNSLKSETIVPKNAQSHPKNIIMNQASGPGT